MVVLIKIWKFLFVRSILISRAAASLYMHGECVFCEKNAASILVKVSHRCSGWKSFWLEEKEEKMRDTHWTLTQSLHFHPLNALGQPLRGVYKLGPFKALSTRNEKPIVESNWNGNTAQKGCALRTTTHMYQLLWRSPGFHIEPNSETEGSEACQWVALLNVFQAMTCTTVVFVWKGCVHISGTPLLQIITQQQATGWQALLSQCDANIASDLQVGDTH